MKKRILSSLLCLAMIMGVFCGCSKSGESAQSSVPASSSQPAQSPAGSPAAPDAAPGSEAITLPLTESKVTYTAYFPDAPFLYDWIDSWDDANVSWKYLEKLTNVHLEFTRPTDPPVGLQTMVASGDYTDLFFMGNNFYVGGEAKAVEDGVYMVLNDYVEKNVPNYWNALKADDDLRKACLTGNGDLVSFWSIYRDYGGVAGNGPLVREDWLKEFGMTADQMTTYDAYHEYLAKAKAAHGAGFYMGYAGVPMSNWLIGNFGVAGTYSSTDRSYPFYQVDGKVKFGMIEDGYRQYLEMISQWYEEGLICEEFSKYVGAKDLDKKLVANGKVSLFHWNAANVEDVVAMMDDSDARFVGIKDATKKEGEKNPFGLNDNRLQGGMQIATTCHDLDVLWQWCNYGYSDEGSIIWTYGEPGVTYTVQPDGSLRYTDMVVNNPDGMPFGMTELAFLAAGPGPFFFDVNRKYPYLPDYVNNAYATWRECSDQRYYLPKSLGLLDADASNFSQLMGDISTYIDECVPQFIMGMMPLSDFDKFVGQLKQMGLEDCIAMYQRAYDAYESK